MFKTVVQSNSCFCCLENIPPLVVHKKKKKQKKTGEKNNHGTCIYTLKGGQFLLPAIFRSFPYFPWVVSMVIFFGVFFWGCGGGVWGGSAVGTRPARGLPLKRGAPVAGAGVSGAPRPGGKPGGRSEGAPGLCPGRGSGFPNETLVGARTWACD